jgi:hypothetical protein
MKAERLPLIILALLSLLSGFWMGLVRIGFNLPTLSAIAHHGAIMVGGFLGTLISLEKIIPLKNRILYGIPACSGLSVVFFYFDLPFTAILLLLIASIALSVIFLWYYLQQPSIVYAFMLAGGICWALGNLLLLLKQFYPLAYPWWMCFALFIIAAERLELMKFLPVAKKQKLLFAFLISLIVVGVALSFHGVGRMISGAAIAGAAIWLMRFDLIGVTINKKGLTQFVAISLAMAYAALLLSGVLFLGINSQLLGYDIVVHSFFIGFVFSMIFAHGPIILPGVLGITTKPFNKTLYFWLLLLHASWILRVVMDLQLKFEWRRLSGLMSAVAIVGYFITMAILTIRSHHERLS